MGVDVIPVELGWEARLDRYAILAKNALKTSHPGIPNTIIAKKQLLGFDYAATFKNLIEKAHLDPVLANAIEELNATNVEAVKRGLKTWHEFSQAVRDVVPSCEELRKVFHEAQEKAGEELDRAYIDDIEAARAIIEKLPEQLQHSAIDVYFSGFDAVQYFHGIILGEIRTIAMGLELIIHGIWAGLNKADGNVHDAAIKAINWIEGIYSLLGSDKVGKTAMYDLPALEAVDSDSATPCGASD